MTRLQWMHRLALVGSVVLAAGVAVAGGVSAAVAVRVALYVGLAVVVESAVRLAASVVPTAGSDRSVFAAAARTPQRRPVAPPERLEELQRAVWHAVQSIGGWHFRLRPVLRDLTERVLADRRGVELDRDREVARQILGDRGWELLRADVVEPDDRWAEGVPEGELEAMVGRIEEL